MTTTEFEQIRKTLPDLSGVYRFYDKDDVVIYVGKAISIRKRVTSYFRSSTDRRAKTGELVLRIAHMDWIACPDEQDALLLENNLIKQLQPKYNINLKDDKTYPYIVISKESFPRVFMTRRRQKKTYSEYFGPYTSIGVVRSLMDYIREQIPLRTCTLNLSEKAIKRKQYRPCLEYHIEKCKAPCAGMQTAEDYAKTLDEIRLMLKGNFKTLIQYHKQEMREKAKALLFEEAQQIKDRIKAVQQLKHRSFFDFPSQKDVDIFCFKQEQNKLIVHFALLRQGCILQSATKVYDIQNTPHIDDCLASIVINLRETYSSRCATLLSSEHFAFPPSIAEIKVPLRGIKKEIIAWSLENIEQFQKQQYARRKREDDHIKILADMQDLLHLPDLPTHIESFDNSHMQGSAQVSAMVCFKNGLPSKKEYRTFHIKSVDKADDYAAMREVIHRRYLRRINEGKPLPKLIIIDGGKGQLNEARKSLDELGLQKKVAIFSIAKKNEHLFFPGDKDPIILNKDSPVLKLVQQIRDETHRFVIKFHRNSQLKKSLNKNTK